MCRASCSGEGVELLVCQHLAALLVRKHFRLESTHQQQTVMPQLCRQHSTLSQCQTLLPFYAIRLCSNCCSAPHCEADRVQFEVESKYRSYNVQQQIQRLPRVGMTRHCLLRCARRSKKKRSVSNKANKGHTIITPSRFDGGLQKMVPVHFASTL